MITHENAAETPSGRLELARKAFVQFYHPIYNTGDRSFDHFEEDLWALLEFAMRVIRGE